MGPKKQKLCKGVALSKKGKPTAPASKGKKVVASPDPTELVRLDNLDDRFTSDACRERYLHVFRKKSIIPERGMEESGVPKDLWDAIIQRNWKAFAKHPAPPNLSIVREVYAERSQKHIGDPYVTVRGKLFKISPQVINKVFKLPDIPEEDDFEAVLDRREGDILEVAHQFLCPTDDWNFSAKKPSLRLSLPTKSLSMEAKIWHKFLASRVRPTSHESSIGLDEIRLLYAVLTSIPIDLGRLIYGLMHEYATQVGGKSGNMLYPSLITKLATDHLVGTYDTDEIFPIKSTCIGAKPSTVLPRRLRKPEPRHKTIDEIFRQDVYTLGHHLHTCLENLRIGIEGGRAMQDACFQKVGGDPDAFPRVSSAPFRILKLLYPNPFRSPDDESEDENNDDAIHPVGSGPSSTESANTDDLMEPLLPGLPILMAD